MLRRFSANFALFSMAMDGLLVGVSLAAAGWLRPLLSYLPFAADIRLPLAFHPLLFPVFIVVWVGALLVFSVYDGRRNLRIPDELASLTAGSMLAAVSIAGVLYLSYRETSRLAFLVFVALAFGLLIAWRIGVRLAFRLGVLREVAPRRVLILGAGKVGREMEAKLHDHRALGLLLVGFLDDDPAKRAAHSGEILGSVLGAPRVVSERHVDDVVLALPRTAHDVVDAVVAELHALPVRVWVIPDYFALALHRASVEEFAGLPMLDLRAPALSDYQRMIKRVFDLIVVLASLPVALPVMSIIALAVIIDSRGPAFFLQQRVGENGRLFNMVKFRTMVKNAESLRHLVETVDPQGNIVHKCNDDPRVTRVGRWLRKCSLDELPQLFNVLIGEMSLVGPRPELPWLVEKYQPWQRRRFAVPQGITGWWQVNGRSDKPMHLNTQDDLYYVQHHSVWLDIQILLRTVWVVVTRRGAY